jgi:AraC-like DNA-binding protein
MGISPKQYVLQKRMALAAKLIREGVPPTKVALRVGYENYSNFYRIYQKYLQKPLLEK